jgi:hypothetical protein
MNHFQELPKLKSDAILAQLLTLDIPFEKALSVSMKFHLKVSTIEEVLAFIYQ